MEKKICLHCGAKLVKYKFSFNKGLASFLIKLHEAGGPAKTDNLGLTYSQRTNSQKLAYWGLAIPYITKENRRKRGWWVITDKGKYFLEGLTWINKIVVTVRGEVESFEGDEIFIADVVDGYKYRADYAEEAEPIKKTGGSQEALFAHIKGKQ